MIAINLRLRLELIINIAMMTSTQAAGSESNLLLQQKFKLNNNSSKKPQSDFFNLNEYARSRILYDMLHEKVLPKCKESPSYIIMVIDEKSKKMISGFCSLFELMEAGNVYQLEKLELKRKRYPMSDAIYMVHPTEENINMIIEDFKDSEEFDYDQYGSVHLCFLTQLKEEQMESMSHCPRLVSKLRTLLELNLDFQVWQDNIFKFSTDIEQIPQLIGQSDRKIVEDLAQKLYTLCSTVGEKPYIQYQGNSQICEDVAISVYKKLEYLYSYSQILQDQGMKKKKKKGGDIEEDPNSLHLAYREPRGTLVIVDRSIDMATPLIHDYQYQSLVFEYLDIGEDGNLDKVIENKKSKLQKQAASEASHVLNEKDPVWETYKNMHIAEVVGGLSEEINKLKQQQQQLSQYKGKENLDQQDIQRLLQTIPEYEKRSADVLIHLDLSQKVSWFMGDESKLNIIPLIEFEQTILSGVNDKGIEVSDATVSRELLNIIRDIGRPVDKLRLLCLYVLSYQISESDFKSLKKKLETDNEKAVLEIFRQFGQGDRAEVQKPTRIVPKISQEDFKQYQKQYKAIDENYDILRVPPTLLSITRDALDQNLNQELFPTVVDQKVKKKQAGPKWQNKDDNSRVIIGVIGGISHNEICGLQNLEREKPQQRLIIGSTHLLTAQSFIDNIVPNTVKIKQNQHLDEEMKDEQPVMSSRKKKKKKKSKQMMIVDEDDQAIDIGDIEMQDKSAVKKQKSQKNGEGSDLESQQTKKPRKGAK